MREDKTGLTNICSRGREVSFSWFIECRARSR